MEFLEPSDISSCGLSRGTRVRGVTVFMPMRSVSFKRGIMSMQATVSDDRWCDSRQVGSF